MADLNAALGAGALGHAVMGVLGPLWIAKSVFGAGLPLSLAAARGAMANVAVQGFGVLTGAARSLGEGLLWLATRPIGALTASMWGLDVAVLADPLSWPLVAIAGAVAGVAAAFTGAALIVRKYWQPISTFMAGVGQRIMEGLAPIGRSAARFLAPLQPVWAGVVAGARQVWTWFVRLVEPVRLTGSQLHSTAEAGRRFGQELVSAIGHVARAIALLADPAAMVRVGAHLMDGPIAGITRMGPAVGRAVSQIGANVVAWFKAKLGIHSPSTVFAELGGHTMAGLTLGLDRASAAPQRVLARLSDRLRAAARFAVVPLSFTVQRPVLPAMAETTAHIRFAVHRPVLPHLEGITAHVRFAVERPVLPVLAVSAPRLASTTEPQAGPTDVVQRIRHSALVRKDAPSASAKRQLASEVHHHHYRATIRVDGGKHDTRQLAREIERHRPRTMNAALHDGGDDL